MIFESFIIPVLFLLIGILSSALYFKSKSLNNFKIKFKEHKKEKTMFTKSKFNKLLSEKNEALDQINIIKNEKENLLKAINKLKKYLGIVNKNEYGILNGSATRNDIPIKYSCEFKVIHRGQNKVKISINTNTVKTLPNQGNSKDFLNSFKKYIDGWFEINDSNIKWIEPDESMKREINIDSILGIDTTES